MRVRVQMTQKAGAAGGRRGLGAPFTVSATLHGCLFALAFFPLPFGGRTDRWGDSASSGGAVAVNLAAGIPLPPSPAPANPLATDTPTVNPPEPKPAEKVRPAETAPPKTSSKEFQIEEKRQKKLLAQLEKERMQKELAQLQKPDPSALPGSGGRASSEIYGRFPTGQGSGGIGFGGDFGDRYGWYVRSVRECIARHWDRSRVDASVRSAPKVFLEFVILRDGVITGERVSTSSGVPSVDREALRAVQACSGRSEVGADAHLPPLPGDYSGSRVQVEVWFEFRQ